MVAVIMLLLIPLLCACACFCIARKTGKPARSAMLCILGIAGLVLCAFPGRAAAAASKDKASQKQDMQKVFEDFRDFGTRAVQDERTIVKFGDELRVVIQSRDENGKKFNLGVNLDEENSCVIRAGYGDLIDHLDANLIGKRVGEVVNITFVANYENTGKKYLRDVKVKVEMTIEEILGEANPVDDEVILGWAEKDIASAARENGKDEFTVYYHRDDLAEASEVTSVIRFGSGERILAANELEFWRNGKMLAGWRLYRKDLNYWRVLGAAEEGKWGEKPKIEEAYYIYSDGADLSGLAHRGAELHLYAQWEDTDEFTVRYYADDDAQASDKITRVTFGKFKKILTLKKLGFAKKGKRFIGWKVFSPKNDTWLVVTTEGEKLWESEPSKEQSYRLYKDGAYLSTTVKEGQEVHLYAVWTDADNRLIYYHADDDAPASAMYTIVADGKRTKTLTLEKLGFDTAGREFLGWRVYSEDDDKWLVTEKDGSTSWKKAPLKGQSYKLLDEGAAVSGALLESPTVHLFAQWSGDD